MAAHPSFSATTTVDTCPDSRLPSISPEPYPPVWLEKQETDQCYNACARLLISEIKADVERQVKSGGPARIGVLFGTHNWESCNIILKELVDRGLAVEDEDKGEIIVRIGTDVTNRLIFGQLYGELSGPRWRTDLMSSAGMSDALTNSIVDRTRSAAPMVIKCVLCFGRRLYTDPLFYRYVPYGALKDVSIPFILISIR
jgi:proline dehydrogenase